MGASSQATEQTIENERNEILQQLEDWLEVPMVALGFVWLALLLIELTRGISPILEAIGTVIWVIFIVDFAVRLILAPRKIAYLKRNWLTAIALVLPALRVFRIVRVFRLLRAARAVRGLRLVRIITSLNRGMKALGRSMQRRGFGYVLALTSLVIFSGAAGMYAFENEVPGGLDSFGVALWWTAMLLTSLGSEYWPKTAEGRVLCLVLSLYGFAVFGYVTATLASFFIGRDAENEEAEIAGAKTLEELRAEITALRTEIRGLSVDRGGSLDG
ncbi:MAG TPA: ion transporter [Blastocatellia bacterium]|nr:ion transporter [Blastocatellia bacterium]